MNTDDSSPGSLRQAILDANANPGPDTIAFRIAGGGVHTIPLTSPLPTITDPVTLNGATQPGFAGRPLIELDGLAAGAAANGLTISAGNSTVRGLVINDFTGNGIDLQGNGSDVIVGNYLGTDATGTLAAGNGGAGVSVRAFDSTIGGTAVADRNIIAGNQGDGILLAGGSNLVEGNYVGTSATGAYAIANGGNGVNLSAAGNLVGGTIPAARNVIAGNQGNGLLLFAGANTVEGNYIGTDATGTQAVGNGGDGVNLSAVGNVVGGTTPAARNVIAGNRQDGIEIRAGNNLVEGNYVGTDATGAFALANAYGVYVQALDNTIGGTVPGTGNVVAGNTRDGIYLAAGGNLVQGDYVGTDATGTRALANRGNGLTIPSGSDHNTIGGTADGAGDVISGNAFDGVEMDSQS